MLNLPSNILGSHPLNIMGSSSSIPHKVMPLNWMKYWLIFLQTLDIDAECLIIHLIIMKQFVNTISKMIIVNLRTASCQEKLATIDVLSPLCNFDKGGNNRSDVFTKKGFINWKKGPKIFLDHEGGVGSLHNKNAQENLKYTSSDIQKDLVHVCAMETIDAIIKDMEEAIERLFATTNLSMSKLWRQGYDGASNMKGELNGLKTKILNKYPQAFYVDCFAYQLQLALVAVAKGNEDVTTFFNNASSLVNIIRSFCKHRDAFREKRK
ncbi:unnamed protein product [Malus baccata var. baccata]